MNFKLTVENTKAKFKILKTDAAYLTYCTTSTMCHGTSGTNQC